MCAFVVSLELLLKCVEEQKEEATSFDHLHLISYARQVVSLNIVSLKALSSDSRMRYPNPCTGLFWEFRRRERGKVASQEGAPG